MWKTDAIPHWSGKGKPDWCVSSFTWLVNMSQILNSPLPQVLPHRTKKQERSLVAGRHSSNEGPAVDQSTALAVTCSVPKFSHIEKPVFLIALLLKLWASLSCSQDQTLLGDKKGRSYHWDGSLEIVTGENF